MKDTLISRLSELIDNTESIYLDLSNRYQELHKQMQGSLKQSSETLACIDSKGGHNELRTRVDYTIKNAQTKFESISNKFSEMHSKDTQTHKKLQEEIESLDKINGHISTIREDSIEMEMISLNAMTTAIKAGEAGKAFSYITDELKSLAAKTITYTETLTQNGKKLQTQFDAFQKNLNNIQSSQKHLTEAFSENLTENFIQFKSTLENVLKEVCSIIEESEEVRQPISRLMEEIQLQDIIKQSLDHVIISLREFNDITDSNTNEGYRDELSFLISLSNLSMQLLNDISDKIESSIKTFKEHTSYLNNHVQKLEKRRTDFLERILQGSGQEESLDSVFSKSFDIINTLFSDIKSSMGKKKQLSREAGKIIKITGEIEKSFESFSSLIARFNNINIAARIEVAKQSILAGMRDTIAEMTQLTKRIENDVETSLNSTKEFIYTTNSTIQEYIENYRREEKNVEQFYSEISSVYNNLNYMKENVTSTLQNFSLYSQSFISNIQDTEKDINSLQELNKHITSVSDKLNDIRNQAKRQLNTLINETELESQEIENKKLQDLISRFTIFTHKETAGNIGGFSVEEGKESGDITFF